MTNFPRALRALASLFLLGVVAACGSEVTSLDVADLPLLATAEPEFGALPADPNPNNPALGTVGARADLERFEVCKRWDGPGPHGVAQFRVEIDRDRDGTIDVSFTRSSDEFYAFDESGWSCYELWEQGANGGEVTVTETGVVGGALPYSVATSFAFVSDGTVPVPTSGPASVTGIVGGHSGVTAFFVNTAEPEVGGGEGCTPGYWKQRQHFDSWAAPYTPDTPFSSVFDDAFPGKTLLEVAKQGGGGLKALGRHTVAALLNGASGGVSYDLSAGQVIDGFNSVFPGGDYESLKNQFERFNEQGCPLN